MSLTAEQKALRRSGIGSSEIGSILGVSRWPVINVWRSKLMPDLDEPETEDQKRGRILEPAVAQWYAEETGARLEEPGTLRHPAKTLVLATPDRIAHLNGARRTVELKTAVWTQQGEWGDAGTDQVPMGYLVQVNWEMACTGDAEADLAVLIGGHDFRIYHLTRDDELLGMAFEAAEKWWRNHVVTQRPPDVDGSRAYSDFLAARYPREQKPMLAATPEVEKLMGEIRALEAHVGTSEAALALAKNKLRDLISDAEGIVGNGWQVTWKANKNGVRALRTKWKDAA